MTNTPNRAPALPPPWPTCAPRATAAAADQHRHPAPGTLAHSSNPSGYLQCPARRSDVSGGCSSARRHRENDGLGPGRRRVLGRDTLLDVRPRELPTPKKPRARSAAAFAALGHLGARAMALALDTLACSATRSSTSGLSRSQRQKGARAPPRPSPLSATSRRRILRAPRKRPSRVSTEGSRRRWSLLDGHDHSCFGGSASVVRARCASRSLASRNSASGPITSASRWSASTKRRRQRWPAPTLG